VLRAGAAGALRFAPREIVVALGVGGRAFGTYLRPVGIELLGDERWQARVGALAHLQVLDDHRDGVVRVDADEGVRHEARLLLPLRRQHYRENEGAACLEEVAPADVLDHASFLAARLMAARMRGRVAQRQMLAALCASR